MVVYINSDISIAKEKGIQTITTRISHLLQLGHTANRTPPKRHTLHAFLQTNAVVKWDYNKPQVFPLFLRVGRENLQHTLSKKITVLKG